MIFLEQILEFKDKILDFCKTTIENARRVYADLPDGNVLLATLVEYCRDNKTVPDFINDFPNELYDSVGSSLIVARPLHVVFEEEKDAILKIDSSLISSYENMSAPGCTGCNRRKNIGIIKNKLLESDMSGLSEELIFKLRYLPRTKGKTIATTKKIVIPETVLRLLNNRQDYNDDFGKIINLLKDKYTDSNFEKVINTLKCVDCTLKHISDAIIQMGELRKGLWGTDHEIFCRANIDEASQQIDTISNHIAMKLRDIRKFVFEKKYLVEISDIQSLKSTYWAVKKIGIDALGVPSANVCNLRQLELLAKEKNEASSSRHVRIVFNEHS